MSDRTHIEWTDATWNPVTGCSLVSEGCRHCYAATLAAGRLRNHPSRAGLARLNATGEAKFTGEVRFNEQWLDQPLRWRRPRRIFVCAHGDLFHEAVPFEWIDRVFAVMALAHWHTFQVLTKRPERVAAYLRGSTAKALIERWANLAGKMRGDGGYSDLLQNDRTALPNLWLGTSVEDQATADARIPHLLAAPAVVRFVSAEPLLGPVSLRSSLGGTLWIEGEPCLDWVIVGGESGHHARPMHPDWARGVRDQCTVAGVPFFFKQWGEWVDRTLIDLKPPYTEEKIIAADGRVMGFGFKVGRKVMGTVKRGWIKNGAAEMSRLGKARAGRLLDGRTWDEMPR